MQTTNADYNPNSLFPWMTWTLTETSDGAEERILLWTNPSPTRSFGAKTIPLDLSEYDFIKVIPYNSAFPVDVRIGDGNSVYGFYATSYMTFRGIRATSDGVIFQSAVRVTSYGDSARTDVATAWVPYRIYGMRKLFNEQTYYWKRTA